MQYRIRGCKYCGKTGHFEFACSSKPRKPLKRTNMNKRGKHYYKWIDTRNKWLAQHKAPYYFCYYCDKMLTRTELTLDHKESRSRHPELRYTLKNLVPCCSKCNTSKGSLSAEEFIERKEY